MVYLRLKPHKCDQCDKSIEAVGNEHSFQYYENIKKREPSVPLATSMVAILSAKLAFMMNSKIKTFEIQTLAIKKCDHCDKSIEAVCNEHSFQYEKGFPRSYSSYCI